MLVGKSDGAMELDGGLRDGERFLRCFRFGGNGHDGIHAIGIIIGGDRKHQGAHGLRSNVHVHRLVLERLKAADGLSELLAQAQIVERDVLRLFHDAKQFAGVREQGEIVECVNGVARRRMR